MIPRYEIVPATEAHAEELARTMRQADIEEVWASSHATPRHALINSMRLTHSPMAGLADGTVLCVYGVSSGSMLSARGTPWMLGSRDLPEHARRFLRVSRALVAAWREDYARLENYADARNVLAIRWLRWLGFTIEAVPLPFGPDKLPFHKFWL